MFNSVKIYTKMKKTILNASLEVAENFWLNLSKKNTQMGKMIFKRKNTESGFCITCPCVENGKYIKDKNGKVIRTVIFTFTSKGKKQSIEWDERYIGIIN